MTWEDKDYKKKLSKDRSKGLSTIRQRLKKYFNEDENSEIVKKMENCRENPEAFEEVAEEVEEEEIDDGERDMDEDSMSSGMF